MSIAFANELAGIAERVGADATDVERGLKTERRIGPRAYLRPGAAFAGGTLARDIDYLTQIGERERVPTQLLRAVRVSNDEHKQWARRGSNRSSAMRVAGWTATSSASGGLSTSRERTLSAGRARSSYAESSRAPGRGESARFALFVRSGRAFRHLHAVRDATRSGRRASAVVVETNWPTYREVEPERLVAAMRTPFVVDANGFLFESSATCPGPLRQSRR